MPDSPAARAPSLIASSPFELRVDQGRDVEESDLRTALATGSLGFLHSFTTGSAVDGPGVRLVAWTAGCMWRCRYCHNPDTWSMRNGRPVTIARATEVLRKYRHGLNAMRGGFTLSGGEPLMQDRFAVRLFTAARELRIHTTLDTNGYYGDRLSDEDLAVIALVMLDIKSWDPARHKALTGMDVAPTLAFARRLAEAKRPMWLRYVLVPGLTDDLEEVGKIALFCSALGNVERVDVLPFHQMGRFKWQQLGLTYTMGDVEPPSTALVERVVDTFRSEGLNAY